MPATKGYGTPNAQSPLAPFNFTRRDPGPTDIAVDILYCGVCHSDLHQVPQRVGQLHLPHGPRPRDRRPRHRRRLRPSPNSRSATSPAVGVIVDSCRHCAHLQRRRRALLRRRRHAAPTTPRTASTARSPAAATPTTIVVDERFVHTVSRQPRPRRRRAAALRRHHHLLAAAPLERRPRQEGRHRRPRRPRPHGPQVRPRLRRPRRAVHHLPKEAKTPSSSAPTRSSSPKTPRR